MIPFHNAFHASAVKVFSDEYLSFCMSFVPKYAANGLYFHILLLFLCYEIYSAFACVFVIFSVLQDLSFSVSS